MGSALKVLVIAAVMSLITACVPTSTNDAGDADTPRPIADVEVTSSDGTAPERTLSEVEAAIADGHVARCRAGYFSDNTDFDATCSGGDGVEFWLSTFGECADGTVISMGRDADCGDHEGFARLMPKDFEPAPEPHDIARCKNGLYTSNTDFSATCSANGGVDRWLARFGECRDGSLIVLSRDSSCSDHDGFGRLMAADFAPAPDPSDIALCGNSLYSSNTDLDATCSANGGVAEWLAPFGTCGDGTVISMGVGDCDGHQGFRALLPPDYTPPPDTTSPAPADTASAAPATTSPLATVPVPVPADGPLALDVLQFIPIAFEKGAGYDRDTFHAWIDGDGDGCNTRAEVLVAESTSLAQVDPSGCEVLAGDWYSSYDGATLTSPADVEIDHVVAMKEAWDSGAWQWTVEHRTAFGNDVSDPRTLVAVSSESNQTKGDQDPSNWLPRAPDVCRYLGDWIAIKVRWSLSMDQSEWGRIKNLLEGQCAGWTIASWAPPPVQLPPAAPLPVVSVPPETSPPPPAPPPVVRPPANCNPNYDPCVPNDSDVDCAGGSGNGPSYVRGPVRVIGSDVYGLDRDNDGLGCE